MIITFSAHALTQLRVRRSITQKMVTDTLKHSRRSFTSYRGRQLYQKQYEDKILEVVAVVEDNTVVIITQYFLEQ